MKQLFFSCRRLLVSILMGFVLTVLVSWCCAVFINCYSGKNRSLINIQDAVFLTINDWERIGGKKTFVMRQRQPSNTPYRSNGFSSDELLRDWSQLREPTDNFRLNIQSSEFRFEDARGWPRLCLRSTTVIDPGTKAKLIKDGIRIDFLPAQSHGTNKEPCVLPLKPIWNGFFVNWLFFATITYGLATFYSIIRFFHRRSNERCIQCGHQLFKGQIVCPECGAGEKLQQARTPRR